MTGTVHVICYYAMLRDFSRVTNCFIILTTCIMICNVMLFSVERGATWCNMILVTWLLTLCKGIFLRMTVVFKWSYVTFIRMNIYCVMFHYFSQVINSYVTLRDFSLVTIVIAWSCIIFRHVVNSYHTSCISRCTNRRTGCGTVSWSCRGQSECVPIHSDGHSCSHLVQRIAQIAQNCT